MAFVLVIGLLPSAAFGEGRTTDGNTNDGNGAPNDDQVGINLYSGNQDYSYIEELLANDSSISFDTEKQTVLVIDVDAVQSEHLKSLNIYQADERIKEYELSFGVSINGKLVENGQTYYLVG